MADTCLYMLTKRELLRISLSKLLHLGKEEEEMVVDWESLSSPPFSNTNLPHVDKWQHVHHFVFDSELYVAIGGMDSFSRIQENYVHGSLSDEEIRSFPFGSYLDPECYCKIYRFDSESSSFAGADRIHQLPTPLAPHFLGNLYSGDVYLLACHGTDPLLAANGLWVLSSSGEWEFLSPPPVSDDDDELFHYYRPFVFDDELFLQVQTRFETESFMFYFDPSTTAWTPLLDDDTVHFLTQHIWRPGSVCYPSVTMSELSNCAVKLSWSHARSDYSTRDPFGCPLHYDEVMLEASLVNNQNDAVILRQRLGDCLKGICPIFFDGNRCFRFVDIGNGMVCALLYGYIPHVKKPVLCISVFTLTMMEANIDINTDTEDPYPQDRSFLSVSVHVKRVFTMKDYDVHSSIFDPFLFTPKGELQH